MTADMVYSVYDGIEGVGNVCRPILGSESVFYVINITQYTWTRLLLELGAVEMMRWMFRDSRCAPGR